MTEIRHHDDRTGKYHNNILGGAVAEEDEQDTGAEEELENNDRDKQHLVRMSRGKFPQRQSQRDRSTKRAERKCVISATAYHLAPQCPEKQRKPLCEESRQRQLTLRTANLL